MAALRAPGGRMQGAAAQAMSVHIVEPPQRRPRPTYAASGGNGGWARRPPGLAAAAPEARYRGPGSAATRRELSRAIIAVLKYRYGTCGFITHAQPHGSCWALPSSVRRRLHGPECGRSRRCSSSTIHTGIAFVVAPCARLTSTAQSGSSLAPERCASIPMRATLCTFTTGSCVEMAGKLHMLEPYRRGSDALQF